MGPCRRPQHHQVVIAVGRGWGVPLVRRGAPGCPTSRGGWAPGWWCRGGGKPVVGLGGVWVEIGVMIDFVRETLFLKIGDGKVHTHI